MLVRGGVRHVASTFLYSVLCCVLRYVPCVLCLFVRENVRV